MKKLILCAILFAVAIIQLSERKSLKSNSFTSESIEKMMIAASDILNNMGTAYKNIKTSKTKVIQKMLGSMTFDKIVGGTHLQRTVVIGNKLERFMDSIPKRLHIPEEYQKEIYNIIYDIQNLEEDEWVENSFLTNNKVSDAKEIIFGTILATHHKENDTYEILMLSHQYNYQLAPHIMVRSTTSSKNYEPFEFNVDYHIEIPRSISINDIRDLMDFIQALNFRALAIEYGMKVPSIKDI